MKAMYLNGMEVVIVSPSGEVKVHLLREYRADCIMCCEYMLGTTWKELKSYGWKCKKVYLNISEDKL